jgi:uncharacterized membrane protein
MERDGTTLPFYLGKWMMGLYAGTYITSLHQGKWMSLHEGTRHELIAAQLDHVHKDRNKTVEQSG